MLIINTTYGKVTCISINEPAADANIYMNYFFSPVFIRLEILNGLITKNWKSPQWQSERDAVGFVTSTRKSTSSKETNQVLDHCVFQSNLIIVLGAIKTIHTFKCSFIPFPYPFKIINFFSFSAYAKQIK